MGLEAIKIVNGDIVFNDSGRVEWIDGLPAIGQKIERRLTTMLTEYPLDVTMGLDWSEAFGRYNEDRIKLAVTECIRQVSEVVDVQNITISQDRSTRKATVSAYVITNYGNTTVETVIQ